MAFLAALAVSVGASIVSGAVNSNRSKKINRASEIAGARQNLLNARGNLALQTEAAVLRGGMAGFNADQILEITAINRANIIAARDRNISLMNIEKNEIERQAIKGEQGLAGNIRATYAASGVSADSGTAKAMRMTEMNEAEFARKYEQDIQSKQIMGYFQTESERARLTSREGALAAEAAIANAEFENSILLAEANQRLTNDTQIAQEAGANTSGGQATSADGSTQNAQR